MDKQEKQAFEALAGRDIVDEIMTKYDAIRKRLEHPDNNLANVQYWAADEYRHAAIMEILNLVLEAEK